MTGTAVDVLTVAAAKITADGVFIEELERNPGRFLTASPRSAPAQEAVA